MKRFRGFLGSLVFVLVLSFTIGGAFAIPQIMNYQGKLTDSAGNPITGSRSILFTIYDASSSGTDLWNETRTVAVSKGIYSLNLGEVTPIPTSVFTGSDRWLGIKVASDSEMTPRLKIASVGNAYRSYDADNLGGKAGSSYLLKTGDTMTGPLLISMEDNAAGVNTLLTIGTTGEYQTGLTFRQYDLSGGGYGKYIDVLPTSNGLIGDGFCVMEGGLIVGNAVTPGLVGQSLGFLNNADLQSMLIKAQWDWDSLGNNRMSFNDDVNFEQNLNVAGTLTTSTFNPASINVGNNSTNPVTIMFDDLNSDGYLKYHDGQGGTVGFELTQSDVYGTWALIGPQKYVAGDAFGGGYQYYEFTNSTSVGHTQSNYAAGGQVDGYTAYLMGSGGTNISDSNYMLRMSNMANPGYMFGVRSRGDLEIGSSTGSPWDVSLRMICSSSSGEVRWMGDDKRFRLSNSVSVEGDLLVGGTSTIEGNANVKGEMMGSRMLLTFNKTSTTADAYFGSAAMAFSAITGYAMPRSGSIVGIGFNVNASAQTTAGDIIIEVRKNDGAVVSKTVSINGTGAYTAYETQARGTDTFAAGDLISAYVNLDAFVGTLTAPSLVVEIQFDN